MKNWIDILAANSASSWLIAGILFTALISVAWLTRTLAVKFLSAHVAKTQTSIDDIVLLLVRKVSIFIVILISVFVAGRILSLPPPVAKFSNIVAIMAVFSQVAIWGNAVIGFLLAKSVDRAKQTNANVSARRALARLGKILLWSILIALCLVNLGVNLTPLLAGIGIGGVAVALALQNILADMFCYIAIIFDRPFVARDFVIVGELCGTVENIGIRTTRVRSLSGELLIFSNQDLVSSRLKNYKTLAERRVVLRFGVTYETPVDKLKRIPEMIADVLKDISPTRLDRVHFAEMGDFSLIFEVVYFVLAADYAVYMNTRQSIHLALMNRFRKEEIDFAYPTQLLYTRQT